MDLSEAIIPIFICEDCVGKAGERLCNCVQLSVLISAHTACLSVNQRPHPELTLVTCYPFYFIGAAPKRFIVHARLRWRWCMKYLTDKPLLTAYRQAVRPDFQ